MHTTGLAYDLDVVSQLPKFAFVIRWEGFVIAVIGRHFIVVARGGDISDVEEGRQAEYELDDMSVARVIAHTRPGNTRLLRVDGTHRDRHRPPVSPISFSTSTAQIVVAVYGWFESGQVVSQVSEQIPGLATPTFGLPVFGC